MEDLSPSLTEKAVIVQRAAPAEVSPFHWETNLSSATGGGDHASELRSRQWCRSGCSRSRRRGRHARKKRRPAARDSRAEARDRHQSETDEPEDSHDEPSEERNEIDDHEQQVTQQRRGEVGKASSEDVPSDLLACGAGDSRDPSPPDELEDEHREDGERDPDEGDGHHDDREDGSDPAQQPEEERPAERAGEHARAESDPVGEDRRQRHDREGEEGRLEDLDPENEPEQEAQDGAAPDETGEIQQREVHEVL